MRKFEDGGRTTKPGLEQQAGIYTEGVDPKWRWTPPQENGPKQWRTPSTMDSYGEFSREGKKLSGRKPTDPQVNLADQASPENLPTPRVCSGERSSGANRTEFYRLWMAPGTEGGGVRVKGAPWPDGKKEPKPRLNPRFVCWLMGFPPGWTEVWLGPDGAPVSESSPSHTLWALSTMPFPPGPGGEWNGVPEDLWPAVDPEVEHLRRGDPANGLVQVVSRVDQLRMLGNAVVPQQAALAFRELASRFLEE